MPNAQLHPLFISATPLPGQLVSTGHHFPEPLDEPPPNVEPIPPELPQPAPPLPDPVPGEAPIRVSAH